MKKLHITLIIIAVVIIGAFVFLRINGEDSWIQDSRGVWIKHGDPSKTPAEVLEQQDILLCAEELYQKIKMSNIELNSQCLGGCGDYAVDIVHVPRASEDNLPENQCEDYRLGKLKHFIEFDKNGKIVIIV